MADILSTQNTPVLCDDFYYWICLLFGWKAWLLQGTDMNVLQQLSHQMGDYIVIMNSYL